MVLVAHLRLARYRLLDLDALIGVGNGTSVSDYITKEGE